jgi:hypothetical protein
MAKYHHGDRVDRKPLGGSGAETSVGSRGKGPGGGQGAKPPEVDNISVK